MANQKKLLILVDGSERSMQTVQYVGQTKPFKDFKLVLFHVFSGVPECYWDMERTDINRESMSQLLAWENQQKKEIEGFMQRALAVLLKEGFDKDTVETVIRKREVGIARDILKEVGQGQYTAVILRRRGVGAIEGLIVGSVANKLFSQLKSCPMMIAGQLPTNQKVMLAIDGSPSSIKAVDFVAEHVGGHDYSVGLVHVFRGYGGLAPEEPDFVMP
ncbi:MAG: universal stress protein, partial [Desulfosalsimonadaceae bacterium]|nr:universal stress protein [Desulfosalsimonadaceae bacterium]